jgi:iron(III) transport system permease protein
MFLPPFLLALGWFQILGRAGPFGSEVLSRALFSEAGMIMVLGFAFAPVVTSLTALALLGIDASLEEAARSMARPVRVVTRILLPSVAPALALAGIIVFALAFSELGVPMFLRVDVFPAAVFARLGGIAYSPGEAVALVLPLLPVAFLLLVVERRFAGSRSFALLGLRNRGADRFALGRSRFAVSAAVALVAVLSIAPLAALALRAWVGGGFAVAGAWLGRAPLNSLLTASAAATVVTAVAIVAGHAVARGIPGARWLDGLAILAFVTPATLLGVGLIQVWNRPATQAVYASLAIVVLGFVARYAAVGLRAMAVAVTQSPPSLEEAAAACGAHYPRRLLGIVLPMHQRGIAFAWLLALVFCLRDLETAVLFYPAGREPLTVRLLTLEANGPEPVVAALSVVHASMTGGVLLLAGLTFSRRAAA